MIIACLISGQEFKEMCATELRLMVVVHKIWRDCQELAGLYSVSKIVCGEVGKVGPKSWLRSRFDLQFQPCRAW
jgi:hypothetical protein